MPSLFVIQGRDQGTRFRVDDTVTIGRGTSNAVQLHDTEVSRDHAEVVRSGEKCLVRDLGSSNGTFVNGRQIRECELASGDQLQVGRTLLLYTGVTEDHVEDLKDKINIVARSVEDGSRIVHSIHQSEGSEILGPPADETASPWLARARRNLQIMYRTALAELAAGPAPALVVTHAGVIRAALLASRGAAAWRAEVGFGCWLALGPDLRETAHGGAG